MTDYTNNYEVGYKKPPKSGQFKPGHSGNPKGRPKDSKSLITIADDILSEKITINENGVQKSIPKREAIMRRIINYCMSGDLKSAQMLTTILKGTSLMAEEIDESKSIIPENEAAKIFESLMAHGNSLEEIDDEDDEDEDK